MNIKKLLWAVVILLLLVILLMPRKEEEILADGTYENCYLFTLKENKMTVLADGQKVTIDCPVGKETEKTDKIVDIQVEKNQVTKITWKEGMITDKVDALSMEEGWITLVSYGKKQIADGGRLYIKTGDEVRILTKAGSLLNQESVSFYIYNDEICAVVAAGDEELQTIRVLLHGETDGIYHENVRLTADAAYKVTIDGTTTEYNAGEETAFMFETSNETNSTSKAYVTAGNNEKRNLTVEKGTIRISCDNGEIRMLSLEHISGYPEYRGDILIQYTEKGFLVRNEVNLEEYLYSVVSSEMPASYPEEALKTQAVCARTYAIYQMSQAYYAEYGAHVDDTVNSQVYNNVAETDSTIQAVEATTGQYLTYDNSPICAYFYSTSCGMTSDVKDVWISSGESPVYLKGKFQGEGEMTTDLSQNEDFYHFITEIQENCFEKEEEWFRWTAEISYEALTEHVEKNLTAWLKDNPSLYHLESDDDSIGSVIKVQVEERSSGGVIKKLQITGEKGIMIVSGEYQIRKVLCPEDTILTLNDGTNRTCNMLPSGYFAVENDDGIAVTGGGYGHGVGMSQNGAGAMAEMGYGYEEILAFYYPETVLLQAY